MGVAGVSTGEGLTTTDVNGNVYVAGVTYGGLDGNALTGLKDFFLTKYDSAGNKLYTKQMGASGANTSANSVASDLSGNVYVAGQTFGGIDGNTLAGTSDFFLTKYSAAGSKIFTKQLGVAGATTRATSIATDTIGNIYVAGFTNGGLDGNTLNGSSDVFLAKYDATGNRLYTKQMDGMGATGEIGGIDSDGNVYYTGYTGVGLDGNTQTGFMDMFLIKYNALGTKLYTRQMGSAGSITRGYSTSTDASGNVYLTGSTNGDLDGNLLTGNNDLFLIKYDSLGNKLFTEQLGVTGGSISVSSVTVDATGNAYLVGSTNGGLDGNALTGVNDLFLTKYDSTGTRLYTQQLGITGKSIYPWSNTIDPNGDIFISGTTNGGLDGNTLTGINDFFVVKYSSSGVKL
jgi:hypothetical protein